MHSNWLVYIAVKKLKNNGLNNLQRTINSLLVLALINTVLSVQPVYADTVKVDDSAFDWSFSLTSEIADNLSGGHKQGGTAQHMARLELFIDSEKLGLPVGSRFKFTLQGVRDGKLSEDYIGDNQGASNIEAPSRDQLYELWYAQTLGKAWDVRLGLIPADNYFNVVDSGSLLLNSSFGVQPIWSGNTVAAIYPTAGMGAMATWHQGAWTDRFGVFQDDPNDRASAFKRGEAWMQELVYQGTGIYKFGLTASHPHNVTAQDLPPSSWSSYFSIDEPLADAENPSHFFLRAGISPDHKSAVRNDVETGLLIPELFKARPNDTFSIGITRVSLRGVGSETAYEATYQYVLSPHVALQPDIQYINRPNNRYPAATVAILRLNVSI